MTQRYEKEIEEILKNAGEPDTDQSRSGAPQPPPEKRPQGGPPPRRPNPGRRTLAINYKHLLGAGIVVLIVSLFYGGLPMLLIGAALLVAGYYVYYKAPRSGGGSGSSGGRRVPKMWRGRTIDPGDG